MGIFNAFTGNLKEMDPAQIQEKYGKFLIQGEEVKHAFQLVRDIIMFTNLRVIDVDLQGVRGKKKQFDSIFYSNIINVSVETAGSFIDDSNIDIFYVEHPRAYDVKVKVLEFPKKFEVDNVYRTLLGYAMKNQGIVK